MNISGCQSCPPFERQDPFPSTASVARSINGRQAMEILRPDATGIYVASNQATAAIEEAIEAEVPLIVAVDERKQSSSLQGFEHHQPLTLSLPLMYQFQCQLGICITRCLEMVSTSSKHRSH